MDALTSDLRLKANLGDLRYINGRIRKKIYRDTGRFGLFYFGMYEFGHRNMKGLDWTGVYQKRAQNQKQRILQTRYKRRYGGPVTQAKLDAEAKIRQAVSDWKNLTEEEKNVYNEKAKGQSRSGYNLYLRKHMLSLI